MNASFVNIFPVMTLEHIYLSQLLFNNEQDILTEVEIA